MAVLLLRGFVVVAVLTACETKSSTWYGETEVAVNPNFDTDVPATMGIPLRQQDHHQETTSQATTHGSDSQSQKRYKVATVEFHRVETPFIIGLWILFASLAKIGEFICHSFFF